MTKLYRFFVLLWYMFLKNVSAIQLKILKLLTSKRSNHKKEFFLPEVGSSNRNSTHKQLLKSCCDRIVLIRSLSRTLWVPSFLRLPWFWMPQPIANIHIKMKHPIFCFWEAIDIQLYLKISGTCNSYFFKRSITGPICLYWNYNFLESVCLDLWYLYVMFPSSERVLFLSHKNLLFMHFE